jgi:hypothetical protein
MALLGRYTSVMRPLPEGMLLLEGGEVVAQGHTDANGMTVRVESGGGEAEMALRRGDDDRNWC